MLPFQLDKSFYKSGTPTGLFFLIDRAYTQNTMPSNLLVDRDTRTFT